VIVKRKTDRYSSGAIKAPSAVIPSIEAVTVVVEPSYMQISNALTIPTASSGQGHSVKFGSRLSLVAGRYFGSCKIHNKIFPDESKFSTHILQNSDTIHTPYLAARKIKLTA